jgi:hypothetical protein
MKIIRFKSLNVPVSNDKNCIIEILGSIIYTQESGTRRRVYLFVWTKHAKWMFWKWIFSF